SAMSQRQATMFREVEWDKKDPWKGHYEDALTLLEQALGDRELEFSLAHRDFTPWNTRATTDGEIYAFDWEFAEQGYIELYDYFHFHFMTHLLLSDILVPNIGARSDVWRRRSG